MEFRPFVILTATGEEIPVQIVLAKENDLQVTRGIPVRRVASIASGGPKRYMLTNEEAWALFPKFLKEVEA